MDRLERAKLKDKVLRFLLRNRNCEHIRFYIALGKPTLYVDDFLNLGLEIYRYEPYILNIHSFNGDIFFDRTELTATFLENGGFTAIEEGLAED
ncbi:hypothetical protein CLV90_3198 [Maribacter spongiicola]|uniref:Uncharacterized protein n=1 Tax=Maribacter spongiicola TaxID=1206753 RepID=A0A4R7JV56_9FLAO|nr:hypothetical protein [Maribacter spongiicola]TDT41965.1 hypothetical protein CLV90_3198 [Maribacter spongiicola]